MFFSGARKYDLIAPFRKELIWLPVANQQHYVPFNAKATHPPPQTPGHLTFLKKFCQILRYVACLDGQLPHTLELQRETFFHA